MVTEAATASGGLMGKNSRAPRRTRAWDSTLTTPAGNVKLVLCYDWPVLREGSASAGSWMECEPHKNLAYSYSAEYVTRRRCRQSPSDAAINSIVPFSHFSARAASCQQV